MYLPIYLFIYPYIYLSIYLFLYIHISIYLSTYPDLLWVDRSAKVKGDLRPEEDVQRPAQGIHHIQHRYRVFKNIVYHENSFTGYPLCICK